MRRQIVSAIYFPNTRVTSEANGFYVPGAPNIPCLTQDTVGADEIKLVRKNGEMADIGWFQILKGGQVIAEIKQSVCHIFYGLIGEQE